MLVSVLVSQPLELIASQSQLGPSTGHGLSLSVGLDLVLVRILLFQF